MATNVQLPDLSKLKAASTPDKELLTKIGFKAIELVENRTGKGKDVDGKMFAPYSKKYEAYRVKKGRQKTVNLEFTGQMLSNMTNNVEGNTAVVLFPEAKNDLKARVHHTGEGKQPKRAFFALNDEDMNKIVTILGDHVKAKLG